MSQQKIYTKRKITIIKCKNRRETLSILLKLVRGDHCAEDWRCIFEYKQRRTRNAQYIFFVEQISISAMPCHLWYSLVDLVNHGATTCTCTVRPFVRPRFQDVTVQPLLKISRDVRTDVFSDLIKPYTVSIHSIFVEYV